MNSHSEQISVAHSSHIHTHTKSMRLRSKREQKNHKSNSWFIHSILFHSLCVRLNLVEEFKRKCRLFCSHCNAIRFDIQFNSIQSEILSFFVKFPNIKKHIVSTSSIKFYGQQSKPFSWVFCGLDDVSNAENTHKRITFN